MTLGGNRDNRAPQSHVHGMPCTLNSSCAPRQSSDGQPRPPIARAWHALHPKFLMRAPTIIRQRAPCNDARTTAPPKSPLRPDDHPMDGRAPPIVRAWHALHPKSSMRGRAHASHPKSPPARPGASAPRQSSMAEMHNSITPAEATQYHDSTRRYSPYRHRYDYVFGRYAVGRYPVLGAVPTLC